MSSKVQTWTIAIPDTIGLYWAWDIRSPGNPPRIVEILGVRSVYQIGSGNCHFVSDFTHWMGPIESPESPNVDGKGT